MERSSQTTTAKIKKSGFSLVEAAIVLGVVGLVIGGIWVAATKVSEEQRMTRLIEGVILGTNNLRQLVGSESAAPDGNGWTITPIQNLCVAMNLFPHFPISNGKIINPFNQTMHYAGMVGQGIGCAMLQSGSEHSVVIHVPLPTSGLCQRFLSGVTARFKDNSELIQVWVVDRNEAITARTTYPISPTGTECSSSAVPLQVRLFFRAYK